MNTMIKNKIFENDVEFRGADIKDSRAVVILLHGRRQNADTIYELAERIGLTDITYILPLAPELTWYPRGFMRDLEDNQPHLSVALERIHYIITDLKNQNIKPENIFLMGFSQGACIASQYLWENPQKLGGVIAFTGGLFGPELTYTLHEGLPINGTRLIFTGGKEDSWVPEQRVRDTAALFEKLGGNVTTIIYSGRDHLVSDEEIELAKTLLNI
ncbi:alpha/beta hydrolase [Acinetobacter baumannii]|uniref:alpha/beta hydrolase n=1 Tax=Acinetobacter baumannii TaxID=470 RepID=UPI0009A96F3A|nr:dienelactone hydrolase family protein [Acinetobacter baumannii]MDC4834585.1 dienelactone hydrolase family protein [Acinetobacter baumannii]MDC5265506.1 dienelactone hydrolase family protein [Acinetobacter baumannii]MDC5326456.1 dienelactone hydrolase family protein [Acinetobacter baumannii]MDC5362587.1 dienelactone hydrolase family protein [Acinetobacter baumannii]MDC5403335.1 dienelactone hydrolase family protein [Acinetobacter baumannii]